MEKMIRTPEGVDLYTSSCGTGVPLLLIHGSIVDSDFFADLTAVLAPHYRVITYDRRGYTRSAAGEAYGLEQQEADALAVLQALSDVPAIVVGCSLGALIAMRLAANHPERVSRVFLHEPPLLCLTEVTTEEEASQLEEMKRQVERGKYKSALIDFLLLTDESGDDRAKPYTPQKIDQQLKNGRLFMEKEFLGQFFATPQDYGIDKLQGREDLVCLAGDASRHHYAAKAAIALSAHLGCPMYYVPGGHNAAHDLPAEFGALLHGLMQLQCEPRCTKETRLS